MVNGSFSILTYNVNFNKALVAMPQIIEKYKPDIICLQEVVVGKRGVDRVSFADYSLAASSGSFYKFGKTFGQATYYRLDKFTPLESGGVLLPKAWYEEIITLITKRNARTALFTEFVQKGARRNRLAVYNLHLTALQATNNARDKQLDEVLQHFGVSQDQSVVVLGDFNYPFRRRSLERIIDEYNLSEATSEIVRTVGTRLWRCVEKLMNYIFPFGAKFDYVVYTQSLRCIETKVLEEYKISDHYPVLSRLDFIPHARARVRSASQSSPLPSPT